MFSGVCSIVHRDTLINNVTDAVVARNDGHDVGAVVSQERKTRRRLMSMLSLSTGAAVAFPPVSITGEMQVESQQCIGVLHRQCQSGCCR